MVEEAPSPAVNYMTVARAQFKIKSERGARLDFIRRPSSSKGMTLYLPDVTNLPGEDGMSCEIRARLAAAVLILGVVWAPAQALARSEERRVGKEC